MNTEVLVTKEEFREVLETHQEFFLMKHSLTCPISASALHEYKNFIEQAKVPCFVLYVQEARELSNHITEVSGVRHESPQALKFKEGKVVWNDSHNAIKSDRLRTV